MDLMYDMETVNKAMTEAAKLYDPKRPSIRVKRVLNIFAGMKPVQAVQVIRCKECKNGAPLPEEARADFSPGVMRCLAGRGDCDRYCTTWEDGFCDEGAKKDGGAADDL